MADITGFLSDFRLGAPSLCHSISPVTCLMASYQQTVKTVIDKFSEIFGEPPFFLISAPGRINVIGEHTDYNEGFVLPIAINRYIYIAGKPTNDDRIRIFSADVNDWDTFTLGKVEKDQQVHWRNYIRGVAAQLMKEGIHLKGAEGLIMSQIAIGAGLSSSAALEAAAALLFLKASDSDIDRFRLALLCQGAEHEYAGVQCGIMDQMATLLSKDHHCLLIDCQSLKTEHILIPRGVSFIVADTGKPRSLAASEYNIRRNQCEEAVRILAQRTGKPIRSLRDVSAKEITEQFTYLPDPLGRRARHVITENDRVQQFVSCLKSGHLEECGRLLLASHRSLRDDYEVSSPELDAMVDVLMSQTGVYGARLTGAGFGGACIAMIDADRAASIVEATPFHYRLVMKESPYEPQVFEVTPVGGAQVYPLDSA